MGEVQAVSGAASIVFACGLTSTVVGTPLALGIAAIGFDNLQAGSQALLNNQPARTRKLNLLFFNDINSLTVSFNSRQQDRPLWLYEPDESCNRQFSDLERFRIKPPQKLPLLL